MLVEKCRSATVAEVMPVLGRDYYEVFSNLIVNAKKSIYITVFQGTVSEKGSHDKIRKLILTIANVSKKINDVKILVYNGNNLISNEKFMTSCIKRGIKVRKSKPSDFVHSKIVVADDVFVLVGSHNMTSSGIKGNYEASVLIECPNVALIFKSYFDYLWDRGRDC